MPTSTDGRDHDAEQAQNLLADLQELLKARIPVMPASVMVSVLAQQSAKIVAHITNPTGDADAPRKAFLHDFERSLYAYQLSFRMEIRLDRDLTKEEAKQIFEQVSEKFDDRTTH